MTTWEHGRCPTCRRRFSVLANGQIHPHRMTRVEVVAGRTRVVRAACKGGEAIEVKPE